ncbi:MAG: methylated-DNA--[protein]-cysteine S-methyltransferase [Myxococcota bacterium]|nr:methylated-DNA--[protein]-cysteine S-methyltransferase [Myxococcales bacterium]
MEVLHYADVETPVGSLRVVSSGRGLVYVELPNASGRGLAGWMKQNAPGGRLLEGYAPNRAAAVQLVDYLEGKRQRFDLSLDLRATPFQLAVYDEVARVGFGETATYAEIAARIGRPKAVRAVGAANGANPIPLVVPCHRIIASSGRLHGYAGGLELKARLLALESAERAAPPEGWLL